MYFKHDEKLRIQNSLELFSPEIIELINELLFILMLHIGIRHEISICRPVVIRLPEHLPMRSRTRAITLEFTSMNKIWVLKIQYASTASTSIEHDYPSPAYQQSHRYQLTAKNMITIRTKVWDAITHPCPHSITHPCPHFIIVLFSIKSYWSPGGEAQLRFTRT